MNGQTIAWSESSPANTDLVGQGDDQIRCDKSAIRTALDDEHNFPSTGGANAGYHRLGSARPFQAAASQVSSTGTIGRLMVNTTDYSLWGDSATNPVPLGHQNLIVNAGASGGAYQRSGTAAARTQNAMQYGVVVMSAASQRVTFASAARATACRATARTAPTSSRAPATSLPSR
mgnify:CR=1 FL=1